MLVRMLLALISLSPLGCDDNPTKPKPDLKTYYFYGLDNLSGRRALRLDPATCAIDTVSDSLPQSNGFAVSADGQYLFVLAGDSLVAVTTDSGKVVHSELYHAVDGAASPDGRYLALLGRSYLGLTILGLPAYDEMFHDATMYVAAGIFSHNSRALYGIDYSTKPAGEVLHVHMEPTISLQHIPTPDMLGALTQVVPSVDEKLLFLYSRLETFVYLFSVYDVAGDSLRFVQQLMPGVGSIAVSPDNRTVYFTNGGSLLVSPVPPPSAFFIYDIATNTVSEVSTAGLATDPELDYMAVGPLTLSPDGKTLVLARSVTGLDAVVFDTQSRTITNYCNFNNQAYFYDMSCQPGR